jgi:transposase
LARISYSSFDPNDWFPRPVARGDGAKAIAPYVQVTKRTVGKWRGRFLARRLDGLLDGPRPGVPRTITDVDVERVLTATLESTPRDTTHSSTWSTRRVAQHCEMSQTAIAQNLAQRQALERFAFLTRQHNGSNGSAS